MMERCSVLVHELFTAKPLYWQVTPCAPIWEETAYRDAVAIARGYQPDTLYYATCLEETTPFEEGG